MYSNQMIKEKTGKIVKGYRQMLGHRNRSLSLTKFATKLNETVAHLGVSVTYQTVKNWEDGIHRPDDAFVLHLLNCSKPGTWQHSIAQDLLAVQWPQLYAPASEIGVRVSNNSQDIL